MLKRIVKMQFQPEGVARFLEIFSENSGNIRAFDGCHYLELLNDIDNPETYFTMSIWEDEAALGAYRNSALFRETWAVTKVLFAGPPVAWSTQSVVRLA